MASDKRNYRHHRCIVKDITPTKSKTKGTPALDFTIDVDETKEGEEYVAVDPITRHVYLYFPTQSAEAREISLRKLRRAGWPGGSLNDLDLIERRVDVVSYEEEYDGKWGTKWDFPSGDFKSERSEEAAMTIDAILRSAPVEAVEAAQPVGAAAAKVASAPVDDDESIPF